MSQDDEARLSVPVTKADHIAGGAAASVTLIEYGDYQCPFCGQAYPIVKEIQRQLGTRLRFVFRNFPLADIHPHAESAAQFAEAAAAQGKFWEVHDYLFEHQRHLSESDLSRIAGLMRLDSDAIRDELESDRPLEKVESDFQDGLDSGVEGTPAFFINGTLFEGNWSEPGELLAALRWVLENN